MLHIRKFVLQTDNKLLLKIFGSQKGIPINTFCKLPTTMSYDVSRLGFHYGIFAI